MVLKELRKRMGWSAAVVKEDLDRKRTARERDLFYLPGTAVSNSILALTVSFWTVTTLPVTAYPADLQGTCISIPFCGYLNGKSLMKRTEVRWVYSIFGC